MLLLATTTGYQTRMFADAAGRLGVEIVYATDRCDQIDDPWQDGAIAVRFHEEGRSVEGVLAALEEAPVEGVLAVGDRAVVLAAHLMRRLGLPGHPPEAASAARDKRLMRARLRAAGLPSPDCCQVSADAAAAGIMARLPFPVVVKPTVLSGSRGVIRADDPESFTAAVARLRQLLASPDVRAMKDDEANVIQVERYIDGPEYAVEALLEHGMLRPLAIFDKPDPLAGPFFEETIYVTPSRAGRTTHTAIHDAVAAASRALGLHHGPIHAECRVAGDTVYVIEVAARPIGGLCARALRFVNGDGAAIGLEELLLRHAMGESSAAWVRESLASGVMMVPIPRGGVYRGVDGVEEARAVPGIEELRITAKDDQRLVPLPEGASYLGFIFARGQAPDAVERSLRDAHAKLRFTIDPVVPMV